MSAPSSSSSSLSPSAWPPPAAPPPPSLQQSSYILMTPPGAPLTASTGTVLVEATSGVQHELPQRYHHHRPVHQQHQQQQASGTSSLACLLAAAGSVGVAGTVVLQPSHRLAGAGSACVSGTASGSVESLSSPPAAPTRPSRPSPRLAPLPPPFQHVLQEHNYGAPPPCSPTPPPVPTPPAAAIVTCPPQSQTSPFSAGPAYVSPSTPVSTGSPSRLAFVHRISPSPSSHTILQSSSAAAVAAAIAALGPPPQPAVSSPAPIVTPSISSSTGGSNLSEPPPGQLISLVDDVGLVATVAASGGRAGARLAGSPPSPPPVPIGDSNGLIGVDQTADSDAGSSANDTVGSPDDSVTRCICDFEHDDGYMICCDRCSAWQHVDCMGLDRGSMPDDFLCHVCEPATLRRLDRRRARAVQLRKRQRLARQHTQQQRRRQQLQKAGRRQLADAGDSTAEAAAGKRQQPATDGQLSAGGASAVQRKRTATAAASSLNKTTAAAVVKKRRMTRESGPRSSTESLKDSVVAPVLNSDPGGVVLPSSASSVTCSPRDYEPAITNHYSPELRARLASMRTGAVPPPPAAGCEPCVVAPVPAETVTTAGDTASGGPVEYCLLASAPLPANTTLVEFRGKCGLADQFRQQHPLLWKRFQPHVLYYKFPRDQLHVCVDARSFGNVARYVRRSCRPNAVVRHVVDKGSLHLYLVASCPIARTAELTIAHEQTGARQIRCACRPGSVECRVREAEPAAAAPLNGPAGYQLSSAVSAQHHHVPALARRSNGSIAGGRLAALSSGTTANPVRKRSAFHPAVSTTPTSSSVSNNQLSGRVDSTNNSVNNSNHRRPSSASSGSSTSTASSGSSSDSSSSDDDGSSSSAGDPPTENDSASTAAQKEGRGETRSSGQRPRQQCRQRARGQLRRQQKDEVATPAGAKKKQSPARAAPAAEKSSPVDDTPPQSADKPRKLTREERKLEAIMKAFERMEKQQQRSQQQTGTGGESPRKGHRSGGAAGGGSPRPSSVEDSTTANSTPLSSTPASAGSLTGRKRSLSRRGGSAAARSRIMSSPRRRKSSGPTLTGATPTAADGTLDDGRQPATAPVQTTSGAAGLGGSTPLSAPVGGHMASQGFRFPRTKKVLMSEWLKETVETVMVRSPCRGDAGADEPGGADGVPAMYTRGARSPPHACRRASLSVVGSDPPSVSLGLTAGSAKKRWLRQAIIEEAEPAAAVTSTGTAGLLNGAANCSSPASRPESPGAFDHITPLKKRLLRDSSAALMSTTSLPPPPAPAPSANPLSSPPHSSNPLFSPPHSANPLSSPPPSTNPLSSPALSSNPLSSPPLPVFCAASVQSDQPLNLSSPLHHRGDDDSSRCSEPRLWIASARPLDARPPEPVKSEWSAPLSVKSEVTLDALAAARDSIAFGCKQLSNDDDVIKRESFADGGLAHNDPPLFACYMNSRSSLVDRLVTARYDTDGYESVKYRPDGQTPLLDRCSPTAVDGDLVKFRRTGDGFPDAANRQWTAMNCAVSPLKFDDQNWPQRSPMAVDCGTGAGGDGPVVNNCSRLGATLLVKKEEELEGIKSDPLDLLTASPAKLTRVFSASSAVVGRPPVGEAAFGSHQVLQDKPRRLPDEEDGEQLSQQRQQAVIKRRLSLQDYRRRKKDPVAPPQPPEPPLGQLTATSEMLPAATAATSLTTSSTLSLTTVSTSQVAPAVEATTLLSSETDRSRSTALLGIDPDDSDSSVTSDSSPLKCSAAGSVLTDVRWNAEPTALERQRETLTARLRRNFGIGIEQQQATTTLPVRPPSPPPERPPSPPPERPPSPPPERPPSPSSPPPERPPSPPPERPPSPSSPPPERPPSPSSPLLERAPSLASPFERPPSPASSPPERPPSPASSLPERAKSPGSPLPDDESPIGGPAESLSSDGRRSSAGSSDLPPRDSFGESSSPSPPPPPASPGYFGRGDALPTTGSLSPPPPPPTPPRLLDPPPSPPPSRPRGPPSPPPPHVVQAPSSPSPPSVPPPQLRVPPPQHPPFPPLPVSLQQRLPPPPFGRQARRSPPPPPFSPSVVRPLRFPPTWRIRSPFAPGSRHALPNGLPTCPPPPPRPRPVRLPPPSAQLLKPPPALPPRRPPPSPS